MDVKLKASWTKIVEYFPLLFIEEWSSEDL